MPKSTSTTSAKKYVKYIWMILVAPVALIFLIVALTAFGIFGDLPTFEELENPNSSLASEVYSADARALGKYYIQNRVNVHYRDLSPSLVNALKATEDVRFEEHSGVDIKGLMRVFVKTIILQQDAGGGSTITQQLAKNLYTMNPDRSLDGWLSKLGKIPRRVIQKTKEWIISINLERKILKNSTLIS